MRAPLVRLACLLSLLIASSAQAITLTFDDITTRYSALVPNGYGGLNWDDFYVLYGRQPSYANSGYDNGTVSGDYAAFNSGAYEATVSDGLFDFNSIYLTAAWSDGLNIRVRGLNSGTVLYDNVVTVDTTGPTLFDFNYLGIDQLIFDSFGGVHNPALTNGSGEHFVMDNMTINATGVPEPSTGLLVIAALIGLGVRRQIFD
jgi:hypothetical protein